LGEEDAKGASDSVLDRATRLGAWFAMVRQVIEAWVEDRLEIIEA
jgi:hypothetical protein